MVHQRLAYKQMPDDSTHIHQALALQALIVPLLKEAHRSLTQHLAEHGEEMSHLQYGVLRMLQRHQTLTSGEISKHMLLDPSTLVPTVNGLEKRGFIQRGRDAEDRRRVLLALTPKANALLNELPMFQRDHAVVAALEQLGSENSRMLLGLLRQLVQYLPDGKEILLTIDHWLDLHANGAINCHHPLDSDAT